MPWKRLRIGNGWDIHPFEIDKPLYLGGICIPSEKGLKGHSDGDVLIHAIIDAICGATGIGNIGMLFPDHEQEYKDIDSKILLQRTFDRVKSSVRIINIDSIIVCESIRLSEYLDPMIQTLSEILELEKGCLQIKPKHAEQMGALGRDEGIMAMVVILLETLIP